MRSFCLFKIYFFKKSQPLSKKEKINNNNRNNVLVIDAGGHGHGDQEYQKHKQREHHAVILPAGQANALRGRFRSRLFQWHVVPALVYLRPVKSTDSLFSGTMEGRRVGLYNREIIVEPRKDSWAFDV